MFFLSIGFPRKTFEIFREHALCTSVVPPGCCRVDSVELSSAITLLAISSSVSFSSETAVALLRESYVFVQRRPCLASV